LIEEAAHAGGFVALRGDEAQLAMNVIWICEAGCHGLIGCGIGFEPGDAFLNGATEANADFEVVAECLFSVIAGHLDFPGSHVSGEVVQRPDYGIPELA